MLNSRNQWKGEREDGRISKSPDEEHLGSETGGIGRINRILGALQPNRVWQEEQLLLRLGVNNSKNREHCHRGERLALCAAYAG